VKVGCEPLECFAVNNFDAATTTPSLRKVTHKLRSQPTSQQHKQPAKQTEVRTGRASNKQHTNFK
jgi:hypothetical protein